MNRNNNVYIAGPIDGIRRDNEPAFRDAAAYVTEQGWRPYVPHDIPAWEHRGACPEGYSTSGHHTSCCFLRTDVITMLTVCDSIFLLDGSEDSRGAKLEKIVADFCGLRVYTEASGIPVYREDI